MTTLEKLKAACEEKKIECDSTDTVFGVRIKSGVWHWFNHLNGELFVFNHTYSQNTGKTNKGILHGISVRSYIEHKTGIDLSAQVK